ncbi:hypothetical protein D0C36_15340 [Mucilaginibacter conchicola]|uniref:Esterase n=1 Tax=Mucilaginibacter conchicola TaxID=2303333 RepID=A0A372NU12_9SPHI|nr:hypothetical protein [Mucilaginibacter conchicola]RFZ92770.1 hypothetical protein D0C36_15340 [Mucilaginibacter conchicola]
MKKLIVLLLIIPQCILAQDYVAKGDSCFALKDYVCAATNYDLYLKTDASNGIAYRAAVSWSLANNKEKALEAVRTYVKFNYSNGMYVFSKKLINDKNFDLLKNDPQWTAIIADVQTKEQEVIKARQKRVDSALAVQHSIEQDGMLKKLNFEGDDAKAAYQKIKHYNRYPAISAKYLSLQFQLTDSSHTAFLVVMPPNYNSKRSYPVMFFLHGAVNSNLGYSDMIEYPEWEMGGWNRFYTKYAGNVIMVYPHGGRDYNWMYPDKGFFMVPAMLRQIKNIINVDDNRVFITGHSNGATGSFSYLMKQPSPYAAFYGFNTRPRVATGGTYPRNILNRSFFNVSTDQDYYFPPGANDSLSVTMKKIGADYQDHRYNGFPHWFPKFDESEPAFKMLFADLAKRRRNPFRASVTWECDDIKYGRCDWLQITELDTTAKRAAWQTDINFAIKKWIDLDKESKPIVHDTTLMAFKYNKKSGAVEAVYKNNVFTVETSDVKAFSIWLSPEMVDLSKPVSIIVNGKLHSKQELGYNKELILESFKTSADRSAIWVNRIDVRL